MGTLKEKLFTTFIVYVNVVNVEKLISKNKVAHGVNINQLHYKYGITI